MGWGTHATATGTDSRAANTWQSNFPKFLKIKSWWGNGNRVAGREEQVLRWGERRVGSHGRGWRCPRTDAWGQGGRRRPEAVGVGAALLVGQARAEGLLTHRHQQGLGDMR